MRARSLTSFAFASAASASILLVACARSEEFVPDNGDVISTVGDLVAGTPIDRDGTQVELRHVVVAAQDTFDEVGVGSIGNVYIQDPGNEPGHGMQCFAPQILLAQSDPLRPGDIVNVKGTFVRFLGPAGSEFMGRELPQMGLGAVIDRVGYWQSPVAIELTVEDYLAAPEMYVGNLITLRDLEATNSYEVRVSASGRPRLEPVLAVEGVRISGELYRIPGVVTGTRFTRITGLANYFYNDFVAPRGAFDVEIEPGTVIAEEGPDACADGADNDGNGATDCEDRACCTEARCHTLILSEVMATPAGADNAHEWIELYNPAGYGVSLTCMSLGRGDAAWGPLLALTGTAMPGECVVVGGGVPEVDVTAVYSPELADGGSPGVGVALFDGALASITAGSLPADAVIYGDDNASMLRDSTSIPPTAHVGTPPEGSSLSRSGVDMATWTITATPTPGDCSLLR